MRPLLAACCGFDLCHKYMWCLVFGMVTTLDWYFVFSQHLIGILYFHHTHAGAARESERWLRCNARGCSVQLAAEGAELAHACACVTASRRPHTCAARAKKKTARACRCWSPRGRRTPCACGTTPFTAAALTGRRRRMCDRGSVANLNAVLTTTRVSQPAIH